MATGRRFPCIIQSHSTTWHDGGVATLLPDGRIYALASERIGARRKHEWDSRIAYEYFRTRLTEQQECFGSETDFFVNVDEENLAAAQHHLHHAAASFYGSPFSEAAILVLDGQGPQSGMLVSTTMWNGDQDGIRLIETPYRSRGKFIPHSLGHFYTAISALAGMKHLNEEGKIMGLASYGRPSRFLDHFRRYAHSRPDGSFYIDASFVYAVLGNTLGAAYFGWEQPGAEVQRVWDEIVMLRATPMRDVDADVTQDDMDIAYAGQAIVEEIILGLARRAREHTGQRYLCLSGGVALNCSANGKLLASGIFDDIYIFPAADDSGQALGKLFYYLHSNQMGVDTRVGSPFLGPDYTDAEIESAIRNESGIEAVSNNFGETVRRAAQLLAETKVIAWVHGRSEIGPRALGHRSILADPRRREMRDYINARVKHREWYRPVAPAVLEEEVANYFLIDRPSPFMLFSFQVRPEKAEFIPAVVHIDGSARLQTVSRQFDERFHQLIGEFASIAGIPVVVNTSFNSKDEPIVETPQDAVRTFLRINLDALVLDRFLVVKRP
ncbi:hypothetical protein HY412_00270 [Candidatus Kaiserbacteria bacterium]|nr:hypothetical protein [Candidatus Kaiserbacteria bacterium]